MPNLRIRSARSLRLFPALVMVLLPLPGRAAGLAPARPLTPAERYGAQLAADYLARGPESIWESLGAGSPLRDLGREKALEEVEVRLGSPEGARWELRTPPRGFPADRAVFSIEHTSGLDEAVVLAIATEGGAPRLRSIRSFSEPPLHLASQTSVGGAAEKANADRWILLAGGSCVVAALALGLAVPLRRLPWAAGGLAAMGVAASAAAVLGFVRLRAAPGESSTRSIERVQRLGHVLPERRRLEAGEAAGSGSASGPAGIAVRLWEAQIAQQKGETARAARLLSLVPKAEEVPWADVLRGRLAFMTKSEAESVGAYQRLIDEGLYHDGLLAEALEAFSILGYPTGREWSLEKLAAIGSRSAPAHYLLAHELQTYGRLGDPVEAFRAGWSLRPMDRRSLFGAGRLWDHLRRPEVLAPLRIGDGTPGTRRHVAGDVGHPPLRTTAELRLCGTRLRATFPNGAELVLPGGLPLAPDGTPVEQPDAERQEVEERDLAKLASLMDRLKNPGAVSQPALRRQLERTAVALANRHRWAEVAALSAGYSGSIEQAPPGVVLLRAEALRRTGRAEPAKGLLDGLERNPVLDRLGSPGLLLALGDLRRATGDLAGAIRVAERAGKMRSLPMLKYYVESLKAEQELEADFATQVVDRFDLRFRKGADVSGPIEVGRILKAEWARMAPWFPSLEGRAVVVDLLPYVDFARAYGTDILGLYDGKIRVPVYGVTRFSPPIVALLTHELAHAMVADATGDRAPSWFHEGLAQRLEMLPERTNRVEDLVRYGTYLSIPAIEEVLRSRPDPDLVEAAYVESEWLVRYVEGRFGRKAVGRLLEAYRDGLSNDESIAFATGLSTAELDTRFRDWALREAPKDLLDRAVVRYDRGRW